MDYLRIFYMSIGSLIVLLLLSKLMGNKQMSELSLFDYIIGITIGSIAAEMATCLESNFLQPLLAMVIYGVAAACISILCNKSIKTRRFFDGRSIILMDKGKLYEKNFKTAKLDLNEFLSQCRVCGYFNIADIQTAVFEANGKLSILPKSAKRPVTTGDMNMTLQDENPFASIIIDGKILERNLRNSGKDMAWVDHQLELQNAKTVEDVFYAACDGADQMIIFKREECKPDDDIFQ
ncbi:MAG: DUF421 domain-containing protein [Bacillota bacterium]|nr:DUF421 domain-containing protein [Bacillota bacterium]